MSTDTTTIKAAELCAGDELAILIGSATAPNAVAVEHVFARIMSTTPKAVRLQLAASRGGDRWLWMPRRALTHLARDGAGVSCKLARWWQPNAVQSRAIDACREVGVLTA